MEWTSEAIVLGAKRYGESSVILEVMTRDRGRHLGLVKGGRSKRMQPLLQTGNRLIATWRARLSDQLGQFMVEASEMRAARLMKERASLYAVQTMAAHLRLLPERDPHPRLYDGFQILLEQGDDPVTLGAVLVRFELALLEDLGFGLDLTVCAATGTSDDLVYVSPKSARAVSKEAGEPYKTKLLPLPHFVRGVGAKPDIQSIEDGLKLSGFFLERYVWQARALKSDVPREQFLNLLG
jgi:DNA repair protein RecO (recombination protein O)